MTARDSTTPDRPHASIELLRISHAELRRHLGERTSGERDPTAPSLLPGWSVGHVLTHIARNADGFVRLLSGADRGEIVEMYVGGPPARNAAIDEGASRSWEALVADALDSAAALEGQIDGQRSWAGSGLGAAGQTFLAVDAPFIRSREVFVHTADLGSAGYTPERWPTVYVTGDLPRLTAMWNDKHGTGNGSLPTQVLALPELDRVLWLLGRIDVADVRAAETF